MIFTDAIGIFKILDNYVGCHDWEFGVVIINLKIHIIIFLIIYNFILHKVFTF